MKWLQAHRRAPGRSALYTIGVWTFLHKLFVVFFRSCYRVQMVGRERIPARGAVILVANHQSLLDPMLVGLIANDRAITTMARRSLFKNPVATFVLRLLGGRPIDRGESDVGAIKLLLNELKAGRAVAIFPEGTRSLDGRTAPLKRGVRLLIKRSNAAVLPVGIEGAFDVWPRAQSRPSLRGRICVRCGTPIDAATLLDMPVEQMLDYLRRELETLRLEARRLLLQTGARRHLAPGPADRPYWEDSTDEALPAGSS